MLHERDLLQGRGQVKDEVKDDEERELGRSKRRRDGPPVLNPGHVWGVREDWGARAGPWGRGARVFERREGGEGEREQEGEQREGAQGQGGDGIRRARTEEG